MELEMFSQDVMNVNLLLLVKGFQANPVFLVETSFSHGEVVTVLVDLTKLLRNPRVNSCVVHETKETNSVETCESLLILYGFGMVFLVVNIWEVVRKMKIIFIV
jgi:hypothetical protein